MHFEIFYTSKYFCDQFLLLLQVENLKGKIREQESEKMKLMEENTKLKVEKDEQVTSLSTVFDEFFMILYFFCLLTVNTLFEN